MNPLGGTSGASGISQINLATMDLETALMSVQQERTKLLDSQLQSQIQEVQGRNAQIAKLNDVLSALNAYQSNISGNDAKDTPKDWTRAKQLEVEIPLNNAIREAGITDLGFSSTGRRTQLDADGKPVAGSGGQDGTKDQIITGTNIVGSSANRGQIEAAITKVKGLIDAQSNNQQMDMLRLQSLSNKRNEAFDTMTNFIKKMQDSRSSIIGNMR